MAIGPRLDLKQGQTLTMTPQLQQAIKLLQLSNLELAEFIEAELEKNPLLEMDNSAPGERVDPEKESRAAKAEENRESIESRAAEHETRHRDAIDAEREKDSTIERAELDDDGGSAWTGGEDDAAPSGENMTDYDPGSQMATVGAGGSMKFDNPEYSLENTLSDSSSLRSHIAEQISIEIDDEIERKIALLMLDHLDESGYMRTETQALAERLGCAKELVETVLRKLQRFDPSGVFARDLSDCLAIQLREKKRLDDAMRTLLDNLDLLAAHDLEKLKKLCGVDAEDIADMVTEIRSLNPKPALEFDHFVSQSVVPDVLMKALPKDQGGGWAVELNADTLPRVLINRTYYAEVGDTKDKQAKAWLTEQMNNASWLVKALDQRAQTILKVATEIVRKQEAFFLYGVEYLKPMVLRDIAGEIDMHESTVSRVTTNKFIGTPRGVFELKYFFSSGVPSTGGGMEYAAEAIKARIRTLIDNEDPKKILSDDALVAALREEGIEIARRTVAKYRESMHIPSSVLRRKQKRNQSAD